MIHIDEFTGLRSEPALPADMLTKSRGVLPDAGWPAGVLDALAAHIAVLDPDGLIVAVNQAWTRFAERNDGHPGDYGIGKNYLATVRASAEQGDTSASAALTGLRGVLAGQLPKFELEYPCHSAQEDRWFLMQVSPLPDGCVVSHIDITARMIAENEQSRLAAELRHAFEDLKTLHEELKRAQVQLVQSEKMASIGQLAAGVAHEINNPIGYLHSNLGTLGEYIRDILGVVATYEAALPAVADPARWEAIEQAKSEADFGFLLEDMPKLLAESQEGIQRVRKIVQDLKDFAHAGDSEDWQWVDLRHSLARTLNIVHNELKYKAEVHQAYEEIPEIRCLPGQLNQVFMNLLVNAAQAIDQRGEVRVRVWAQGEQVWVEVADTGCGMPPEVVGRIFEPFFTTKPVGKGTGLGLSISYGIVKKHGGHIEVDSQIGRGTTFRVVLPVAGPTEAEA
jgi:two-component system NtrC family sensor kinase